MKLNKYYTVSVGQRLICTACNRGRPIYLGQGWVGACAVCAARNMAHPVSIIGGGLVDTLLRSERITNRKDSFTRGSVFGEIEIKSYTHSLLCDGCRRGFRLYIGRGKVDLCDICSPAAQRYEALAMRKSIANFWTDK